MNSSTLKEKAMMSEINPSDVSKMSASALREYYYFLFGQPSRSGNVPYLRKRIAWRIQSLKEGPLTERARKRAAFLANEADIRSTAPRDEKPKYKPRPKPVELHVVGEAARDPRLPRKGVTLKRIFKGKEYHVLIQENTFVYDGKTYRSLSAVAKAITGIKWNGFKFFDLEK